MAECDRCGARAVYNRRYCGQRLCRDLFFAYIEARVRRAVKTQKIFERGEKVGVALSGGKDSSALLYLLSQLSMGLELHPIAIDEGIAGYRPHGLEAARALCSQLGLELHTVSFRERLGHTLDEMVKWERGYAGCTYCGVFRRRLLNDAGRELGLSKIATGHNLDDEAQAVMMNYTRGDIERLLRLGTPGDLGLLPRVKPLQEVPEKEVAIYALLRELPVSLEECPYARDAFRLGIRDFLNGLELANPGIKYSILRGYKRLLPHLATYPRTAVKRCGACGEPTPNPLCKACELLGALPE
ncbi:MAG: TIGR00269 family protein [Euryarchaeota archaeon]|nr:TIGR00269 family protein [Euryarchaeota archaeon]